VSAKYFGDLAQLDLPALNQAAEAIGYLEQGHAKGEVVITV
jgi:hypothetical protein